MCKTTTLIERVAQDKNPKVRQLIKDIYESDYLGLSAALKDLEFKPAEGGVFRYERQSDLLWMRKE